MSENRVLLEVQDLKQYFDINTGFFRSKPLKAVDGVSFSIRKGETLGLVGESGCDKTRNNLRLSWRIRLWQNDGWTFHPAPVYPHGRASDL